MRPPPFRPLHSASCVRQHHQRRNDMTGSTEPGPGSDPARPAQDRRVAFVAAAMKSWTRRTRRKDARVAYAFATVETAAEAGVDVGCLDWPARFAGRASMAWKSLRLHAHCSYTSTCISQSPTLAQPKEMMRTPCQHSLTWLIASAHRCRVRSTCSPYWTVGGAPASSSPRHLR